MLISTTRLALLLVAGAVGVSSADEKPCTTHANGKYYDLNPLKANKDYEIKTTGGKTLKINVCQSVRSETFGLKDLDAADVAGFIRQDHGDFAIGKVNTTLTVFETHPRIAMSDGSRCKSKANGEPGDNKASSVINFICDHNTIGSGQPRLYTQLPPGDDEVACSFVIEWKTQYACPASEGGWGFFSFIAGIFIFFLMTYTILGTVYNRYVLGLRGFDQIPQFSIESMKYHASEALDWLRDIAASMNINLGRSGGGGAFGGATRGSANPYSHQAQAGGFGLDEDLEDGMSPNNGGFIRPQAQARTFSRRAETNPVSHQSQVEAERQQQQNSFIPQSHSRTHSLSQPPPPPPKESTQTGNFRRSGTPSSSREERAFMLGDDEEEDLGEELVDVKTPSLPHSTSSSTGPSPQVSSQGGSPLVSVSDGGSGSRSGSASPGEENPTGALRGRDLGDSGVIRL
ncbi:hypothetical protein BDQ12DRAFT_720193 [Crucibulum laeve]|uniref:Autophagy-related protein 27 n=1 Tax=Crucibulum laeve TaxID=68775 RepID=A0A5C3MAD7_9AGAR|nr:hypothetical protein BDQ12DRAFT_720193 [Crucibulum laeve]